MNYGYNSDRAGDFILKIMTDLKKKAIEKYKNELKDKYGEEKYRNDEDVVLERILGIRDIQSFREKDLLSYLEG